MVDNSESAVPPVGPPQEAGSGGKRSRRFRIFLIVVVALLAVFAILGIFVGIYAWRFNRAWKSIVIGEVDLSRIPDGAYEGSHKNFHDSSTVRVTVRDHLITDIEILQQSPGNNRDEMEELARRMVDSQSLEVDAASGSTASSMVLLKAVENALSPAQR